VQGDCNSLSSDVDVTSCDLSSVVDDDSCDVNIVTASTPDHSADDMTSHQREHAQLKRIARTKRKKQLLTERPSSAELSHVCFYQFRRKLDICSDLSFLQYVVFFSVTIESRNLSFNICKNLSCLYSCQFFAVCSFVLAMCELLSSAL